MRSVSWHSVMLCLLLLAGMGLSLAGCSQQVQVPRPTPPPTPNLQAVQAWIQQAAIPLTTTDPQAALDDLQPLQQMVGNATIVGLGEESHGSHEFFTMKQRLVEFLVEKMGFTLFAIEGSWTAGMLANQYVLTGQGDPQTVLQQFHEWIWNTQEVLSLLEWMRAYNTDPTHAQKVHLAGFDMQELAAPTFDDVVQYIQMVDPQQATQVASLYDGIRPDPSISWSAWDGEYFQQSAATKQQYIKNAQTIGALLQTNQSMYEGRSSPQAFALALQDAEVIVQSTQLSALDPNTPKNLPVGNNLRDSGMADNIAWLHAHADGGEKMILWAHDGHIGASNSGGYITMGQRLRQQFEAAYLPIGFSFYQGAFNAISPDGMQVFTEQNPPKGSYNETLGSVPLPLYLLDLRAAPAGPVSQWLAEARDFHELGVGYDPAHAQSDDVTVSLRQYFDLVIEIQTVTASHLIPLQY